MTNILEGPQRRASDDPHATRDGWTLFVVMLGAMAGMVATDVSHLSSWQEAVAPPFVAAVLAHFGILIGAFIGGKKIT